MNLKEKHEKFLYPVVRIFSKKAAGSGTIIYCQEDGKNPGEYLTFVLTNHHVIDDLVTYKKEWDSVLKKDRQKEFLDTARVEIFSYVRMSEVDSSNRYGADVVAYDKNHDLAILKMDSPRKIEHVARIIPEDRTKDLKLFMDICVSGCSMAHEPFCNFGQLTFLKEIIDQRRYWMYNAGSYFGNSGGALFLADTGELIGVPSRLTGIQIGFGMDMVTFMGFAAHSERLYQFFREQHLDFIFDPGKTYYDALDDREKSKKKATLELQAELSESGKDED